MADVILAACPDYAPAHCRQALEAALAPLGGLDWVRPGMRIGIKANLVAAMAPDTAATTHPALLAALTALLKERGASVVIGDSPGGLYTAAFLDRVYRVCGLDQAERAGAELNRDFSQKAGTFPQGAVLHSFQYTGWLDGCDAVINFCKLKTHGMMGMSAAVKNFFGSIPGTMKPEYHFRFPDAMDFARMLVDLQLYWKPRLHLVDAVTAMEGNGPTAGTPHPLGLILAAESPFALDAACASLLGLPPDRVLTQAAAMERGLVPAHLEIQGSLDAFRPDSFQLPPTGSTLFCSLLPGRAGAALGRVIQKLLAPRPQLHPPECVGCKKCANICPARAIEMVRGKPRIHRRQCIACFCCQEFCPKGAMKVRRPPVARLLNRGQ